jgi:Trypsin-like peptidase domain
LFAIGLCPAANAIDEKSYIDYGVQVSCSESRGAGFFLENKVVVTAKHVVEDCQRPTLSNSKGEKTTAVSILFSENKDLAYLIVQKAISPTVAISKVPAMGAEVFTVGSPIDGLLLSKGKLKEIFRDLNEEWLVLDIPADHGSSGGPVFSSGGLIGLVISKDKRNGDIYAYKAEDIKADYRYASNKGSSGQNFPRPVGKTGADVLMPILISATITFIFGIGVGVMISRRNPKTSKRRIRIEV